MALANILPLAADVLRPAVLWPVSVACLLCLGWRAMAYTLDACAHHGARNEVTKLRRDYIERRSGLDRRRDSGSPPPLPLIERRRGQRRRRP